MKFYKIGNKKIGIWKFTFRFLAKGIQVPLHCFFHHSIILQHSRLKGIDYQTIIAVSKCCTT